MNPELGKEVEDVVRNSAINSTVIEVWCSLGGSVWDSVWNSISPFALSSIRGAVWTSIRRKEK